MGRNTADNEGMTQFILVFFAVFAVSGCASAPKEAEIQAYSSGHVGCEPADIKVANWKPGMGYSNWDAECKGTRYKCTASLGGSKCTPLK